MRSPGEMCRTASPVPVPVWPGQGVGVESVIRAIHGTVHRLSTAKAAAGLGLLDKSFPICSIIHMTFSDRTQLCEILMNAPAWARVGLTMRDARMRERAADALAATIQDRMHPQPRPDPGQLALPL